MDGDTGFNFSAADLGSADGADPMASWGDMFLDSIHSDEPATGDSNSAIADSGLGQHLDNSSQSNAGGTLFQLAQGESTQDTLTNIPTHLQASVPNNSASNSIVQLPQQQLNTSSSSSIAQVAYINPSTVTQQQTQHQQLKTVGSIQNILPTNTTQQQQTGSQANTKLVQIAPSIPVATVQQLANPLQTLLQPNQALATGQTIYGNQNQGLFPQGSVHIENPKVVNVNFGPHVIQQDGSGQPAIIQTAEGKRVLITNQLQGLPQSLSLTQPIMGTHLINAGASMGSVNQVIRTTVPQTGGPTLVPSSNNATNPRQIVLPAGQTVIPRQPVVTQQATAAATATGFSKNVVLRQINPSVQSVIYQGGQNNVAGQLIQSPQTLIASSGAGLQVVSAGTGNQGNQVQLIAQPSLNQATMGGQQLNQNTLMNLINNQGMLQPNTTNQLSGLVSGQNILLNGQMININQLGGLAAAIPQLQVNNNAGAADTTTVTGVANRNTGQFQPAAGNQQVFISQQQQQLLLQPKANTPSPSLLSSSDGSQKLTTNFQGKIGTPLHNSASSTPALTPTPSTPTPTPTPDNIFDDLCGSGGNVGKVGNQSNILEQALKMSSIDFSLDDFLSDTVNDCSTVNDSGLVTATPVIHPTPAVPLAPVPTPPKPTTSPAPLPKAKPQPAKSKKASKSKQNKQIQPIVNVTVNNNLNRINANVISTSNTQQVANATTLAPNVNIANVQQGQKVGLSPQIITPAGQVYVLSADGQQLVLQQQTASSLPVTANLNTKPSIAQQQNLSSPSASSTTTIPRPNINIPATGQGQAQQQARNNNKSLSSSPADMINNRLKSQIAAVGATANQMKATFNNSSTNQRIVTQVATSNSSSPVPVQQQVAGSHVFVKAGMASLKSSVVPVSSSQSLPHVSPSLSSQANFVQVKNQQISTLAGKFIKQEPVAVVKNEPADVKPAFSFFDPSLSNSGKGSVSNRTNISSSQARGSPNLAISSANNTSRNISSDVGSGAFITTSSVLSATSSVATTSSHNSSIMSAGAITLSSLNTKTTISSSASSVFSSSGLPPIRGSTSAISASASLPQSSESAMSVAGSSQPSIPSPVPTQQVPAASCHGSRKIAKSKEPANMKTLTQIKIANSTLTLSLTPGEKEKFERELSGMSMEKQLELLARQQNVIKWSHEKQMKQKQQQQQQQQQQQNNNNCVSITGNNDAAVIGGLSATENKVTSGLSGQQQPQQNSTLTAAAVGSSTNSPFTVQKGRKAATSVTSAISSVIAPVVDTSALPTTIQDYEDKSAVSSDSQLQSSSMDKSWQQQTQQQRLTGPVVQQEVPPFKASAPSSVPPVPVPTQQQPQPQLGHQQQQHQQQLPPQQFTAYQPVGRCLAEQQLSRDRSLALDPETHTQFKSYSDAMRRLVRFHTLQDHKPEEGSTEFKSWDAKYSKVCEQLVQRKRRFMRRFTRLMIYQQNITSENHPESLQNLKCFNENLRETLARQKEEVIHHPESYQQSYQRYLAESQMMEASLSSPHRGNDSADDESEESSEEEEVEEEDEGREEEESDQEDEEEDDERSDCDDDNLSYQQNNYYAEVSASDLDSCVKQEIKAEPHYSPPSNYLSSKSSSSSLKRKHTEKASSGTLKLVFKRRNTDDQSFTIKASKIESVSEDYKPVVDLDKSDNLYEFDTRSNGVHKGNSVMVKRRESSLSQVSRQTSVDNRSAVSGCEGSSFMSSSCNDDIEEDMEDDNDSHQSSSQQGRDNSVSNNEFNVTDEDEDNQFELQRHEKNVSEYASSQSFNYNAYNDRTSSTKKSFNQEVHPLKSNMKTTALSSSTSHQHSSHNHSSSHYSDSTFSEDTKVGLSGLSMNSNSNSSHHQNLVSNSSSSISTSSLEWGKNPHSKNRSKKKSINNQEQISMNHHQQVIDCDIKPDIKPEIRYSDISAPETISISGKSSSGSKKSDTASLHGISGQLSRMQHMSTASDDVFISGNQDFPSRENSVDIEFQQQYHHSPKSSGQKNSSGLERQCSVGSNVSAHSLRLNSSSQSSDVNSLDQSSHTKFIPETPTRPTIPQLGSSTGSDLFPARMLFTTPNKSLLQTDAMFNTSSEDEEDVDNNIASAFKIDNRDPQSSMVSDSVQTVINSVINNDDDDDVIITGGSDNHHPHGSGSIRRGSSSSVSTPGGWMSRSSGLHPPTQPFFSASSFSSSVHTDEDLDAAVQSILNNPHTQHS